MISYKPKEDLSSAEALNGSAEMGSYEAQTDASILVAQLLMWHDPQFHALLSFDLSVSCKLVRRLCCKVVRFIKPPSMKQKQTVRQEQT
eukprot:4530377-Amphidinium_carterae.1